MTTFAPLNIPSSLPSGWIVPRAVVAGEHQAHQRQDKKSFFQRSRLLVCKRRGVLGDKRPQPHHFRVQFLHKDHVLGQTAGGLTRRSYHDPAAGLVSDLF